MLRIFRLPPIRPRRSPLYYPLFAVSAVLTLGVLYGCKDAVAGQPFARSQATPQPAQVHASANNAARHSSAPGAQWASNKLLTLD